MIYNYNEERSRVHYAYEAMYNIQLLDENGLFLILQYSNSFAGFREITN